MAIEIERAAYSTETNIQSWWWDQGSGDCSTRTSDVVSTEASIAPTLMGAYEVSLDVPLMGGGTWTVLLTLEPMADGLHTTSDEQDAKIDFIEVETVDPEFAPVS